MDVNNLLIWVEKEDFNYLKVQHQDGKHWDNMM